MLKISNISKNYGSTNILDNISFKVESGLTTVIWGPSGCGKTTLFNILSGLDNSFSGIIQGRPDKLSYCFQEDRLLNHLTTEQNIRFVEKEYDSLRLNFLLEMLQLKDNKKTPVSKLSGGQKQRVSIARALYYNAPLILLDEPFKSLDLNLKINIIKDFNKIQMIDKCTSIIITHDIFEAFFTADIIYVLTGKPSRIRDIITLENNKSQRNFADPEILKKIHNFL